MMVIVLFFGVYFRFLDVKILFLKAESGLYLEAAFSSIDAQRRFAKDFMLVSQNGHFTPLVFIFEFIQSKIYGSNESLWFWRQMLVCGILATSLSILYSKLCQIAGLHLWVSWTIGGSVAVIFVCQPMMIDMIV